MPKSNAEMVRASAARRRQRSREAGLCYTCCKQKPNPGRVICVLCNAAVRDRKRRKRQEIREHAQSQPLVKTYEHAGDIARKRYFHDIASEYYQNAFSSARRDEDKARIAEKLASTTFLGYNPAEADRWFEENLLYYAHNPEGRSKIAELLLEQIDQFWSELRYEEAIAHLSRASAIAKASGDERLYKLANLKLSTYLRMNGRLEEARKAFEAVGEVPGNYNQQVRRQFLGEKANRAALEGFSKVAFEDFERLAELVRKDGKIYNVVAVWNDYGRCAKALGNTLLAKANLERALLATRQNRISWYIPYACLEYADLLRRMGHYDVAHHYLREALSVQNPPPAVQSLCAEVGIPLALEINDHDALSQCTNPDILTRAFQSKSPLIIGPVAMAFARFYASTGKARQAQGLLHRALKAIKTVDFTWDICLEVARLNKMSDIPLARSLLEQRVNLPSSLVAQAYLSLFDAIVAQRNREGNEQHNQALEGARCKFRGNRLAA